MNTFKRITVIFFAVLLLAANLPLCASATDPVSAATMANAVAQAISAYGASQGVSMTFDVASTDGIGEGVHDLWDQFKEDIQDDTVPTYDSLAVTMWADVYTKVGNNVGIFIDDTVMPFIDAFWNWLFTGPAEMVKVDNQYYQFQQDSVTGDYSSIVVYSSNIVLINNVEVQKLPFTFQYTGNNNTPHSYSAGSSSDVYAVCYRAGSGEFPKQFFSIGSSAQYTINDRNLKTNDITTREYTTQNNTNLGYLTLYANSGYTTKEIPGIPEWPYDSNNSDTIGKQLYTYLGLQDNEAPNINSLEDEISIRPYIGDTVPQDVYIPDNEDVNYVPLPYVGGLDIPWDDTLFGDGSGTLTDAQSEAISGVVDDAITNSLEKTLTLAETDNPSPPISEVYIPFLPVNLPSFNFSLSGIWHYVREWIASLGAWFTMVLTIWSNLPYAIVVPVYATMVILIVLGVYKRFFM